jgi:5-methylcytosine-specific restriction endonuclease McrA
VSRHGRRSWGGRRVAAFRAQVLARYGTRCHLCGREGADSPDHLLTAEAAPHLEWDLDNVRPAHRACNYARKDMPLDQWFARHPLPGRPSLTPSREW